MKNPPILVSVIGFFAVAAGVSWIVWGLRLIGFDWFNALGDLPHYDQAGLWGWLAIATGIVWLAVGIGLWTLQSWAWVASLVIAGVNLVVAFLWFLAYPGSGLGFGLSIIPFLILLYLNTTNVRESFSTQSTARAH